MSSHTVHVRRRFLFLYLPLIAAGMTTYMWASMLTLTFNGGSLLGLIVAGTAAVAAARDVEGRQ